MQSLLAHHLLVMARYPIQPMKLVEPMPVSPSQMKLVEEKRQ